MQTLQLQKNQEKRLLAGHLWIFSNEVDNTVLPLRECSEGELAIIKAYNGRVLGKAYVNPRCLLCARLLTRNIDEKIDKNFFLRKIEIALKKRSLNFSSPYYRLIYGESDGLPGLVIDRFNEVIVIQINTAGMEKLTEMVIDSIVTLLKPTTIVLHNESSERVIEGLEQYIKVVYGKENAFCTVLENQCEYRVPLLAGQKTGWFYDQRYNRKRIATYCRDKKVLDMFSYLGAFGLPCAKALASSVLCVDSSPSAVALLQENIKLNQLNNVVTECADGFLFLKDLQQRKEKFDVIILDPPAFIKRKKDFNTGFHAYIKLNQLALTLLNADGVLFSASCSMHLSAHELLDAIRRAALKSERNISVLEQCHQATDHPVHPAIAETNYLKGFIIYVV